MDTSRARTFVLVALAVLLGLVTGAASGHASCDPTTDPDKTDVANARAAVAANCDCAGATSHGAYLSCAVQQAQLTLVNGSCAGAVKRCAARSTCGKPGAVMCCVTKTSGTKCRIKRDARHCTGPAGSAACVGSYTSCCDAGSQPCGDATFPFCNGTCPQGEHCGTAAPLRGAYCFCVPNAVTACGSADYPTCQGFTFCPSGVVCAPFKLGTFTFCGCVTPVTCACGGPPGLCGPGEACLLGAPCGCGPQ